MLPFRLSEIVEITELAMVDSAKFTVGYNFVFTQSAVMPQYVVCPSVCLVWRLGAVIT